jgi:mono/diheme cytochrome c family protein
VTVLTRWLSLAPLTMGGAATVLVGLALGGSGPLLAGTDASEALTNPMLGQPEAIEAGRDIYRAKCLVCHQSAGARGPNLFATRLSDEQFLYVVIRGRKGTQMPSFGVRLSPDEVWQVHAFVKSTDHY